MDAAPPVIDAALDVRRLCHRWRERRRPCQRSVIGDAKNPGQTDGHPDTVAHEAGQSASA
jgi:hypothetical protein